MRKLLTFMIALAAMAFAVCSPSFGQVGQMPMYITPPPSGGSYTGPGNVVGSAIGFWSCGRAYNSAYANGTNPLCDLKDASTGTVSICTLRVASTGFVDLTGSYCTGSTTPAVACAAAAGGYCIVSKAYDQTGTGNDLTQATAALMPPLAFSILNGLPCLHNGPTTSNNYVLASASLSQSLPYTYTAVTQRTGPVGNQRIFASNSDSVNFGFRAANLIGPKVGRFHKRLLIGFSMPQLACTTQQRTVQR